MDGGYPLLLQYVTRKEGHDQQHYQDENGRCRVELLLARVASICVPSASNISRGICAAAGGVRGALLSLSVVSPALSARHQSVFVCLVHLCRPGQRRAYW